MKLINKVGLVVAGVGIAAGSGIIGYTLGKKVVINTDKEETYGEAEAEMIRKATDLIKEDELYKEVETETETNEDDSLGEAEFRERLELERELELEEKELEAELKNK